MFLSRNSNIFSNTRWYLVICRGEKYVEKSLNFWQKCISFKMWMNRSLYCWIICCFDWNMLGILCEKIVYDLYYIVHQIRKFKFLAILSDLGERERERGLQLGIMQGRNSKLVSLSKGVRFQPLSHSQLKPNRDPESIVQFPFPQFTSLHMSVNRYIAYIKNLKRKKKKKHEHVLPSSRIVCPIYYFWDVRKCMYSWKSQKKKSV